MTSFPAEAGSSSFEYRYSSRHVDIRESRISSRARMFPALATGYPLNWETNDRFQGTQSEVRRRRPSLFPLLQGALRQSQFYGGLALRKITAVFVRSSDRRAPFCRVI
jgi:hypothetical protein